MFERFTARSRRAVVLSEQAARALRHPSIGTEHLLLGLIAEHDNVAAQALAAAGVTSRRVTDQILALVGLDLPTPEGIIPFTPDAKFALESSLRVAVEMGHDYIGTGHVLLGILRTPQGLACRVLQALAVDPHGLYNFMVPRMDKRSEEPAPEPGVPGSVGEPGRTLRVSVLDGVAGSAPGVRFEDVSAAREQIARVVAAMFELSPDGQSLPNVTGGNLGESLRQAWANHPYFARTPPVVVSIDFTSHASARISFALGNPEEGVKWLGEVNRVGDRWLVSRATAVEVLQQAGVICPPAPSDART